MAARLAAATLLTLSSCAQHRPVPSAPAVVAPTGVPVAPTTAPTTVAPTTTLAPTTVPPPPAPAPASTAPRRPAAVGGGGDPRGDDFWRRLADCECASGRCGGAHVSYFQFSPDTARKVGIDGSEPYEEQRAAAQEWARRIHPREGTSAGWPVCWWKAAA